MRRFGAVLATAALAVAPIMASAAPASADTEGCVTKTEFRKVSKGWALKRVHRVFDTAGKQSFFYSGYQTRDYRPCRNPDFSFVMVDYEKRNGVWRVTSKSALRRFGPPWIGELIADPAAVGLALGVLLGGLGQLLWQVAGIYRSVLKGHRWWRGGWPWSRDVKNVVMLMAPAAIAASSMEINVVINTNFATSLRVGSVVWLNYAFQLLQLPIGLFGVAVGSAVLPALSRAIAAAGRRVDEKASREFQGAVELVLWLMVPCMVFFMHNSEPLIRMMYQYGKFTPADTVATADALFAYSFSVVSYGLIKVLTAFYYSVGTHFIRDEGQPSRYLRQFRGKLVLRAAPTTHGTRACEFDDALIQRAHAHRWIETRKFTILWRDLGKTIGLLAGGALVLLFAQTLWQPTFDVFAASGRFDTRLASAVGVVANGTVVVVVFFALGLIRLRMSPLQALQKFRRRGRRNVGQ